MADNITVSQGSGTTIATDDIGGTHYQITKVAFGADGSATLGIGGAGAVTAGVQRVTLASDDVLVAKLPAALGAGGGLKIDGSGTAIPISGTIAATQSGTWNIGTITTLPALPAGTNSIGLVNVEASLKSGTATRSTVASTTTSTTIIAANSSRKGVTICNQDANALLLDMSAGTASATRYQERLTQGQSIDIAAGYTGAVTGVWEADGTGQADVVEFT